MKSIYRSPLRSADSENMTTWLKLRRELEDRITDEEVLDLLHQFSQVDIALCEEEANESFWRGVATGVAVMKEIEEQEKREFEKLYRQIKRKYEKSDQQQNEKKTPGSKKK